MHAVHGIRRGLTLIELLVVIAIIAVLASLLVPAVLQSRSAARKTQCGNNLKQLATGAQQFHQRHSTLPVYWGAMNGGGGEKLGGWILHMLPDLEQQAFYDSLPVTGGITRYNWVITGTAPAVAPSNPFEQGRWETKVIGQVRRGNIIIDIHETRLVGQVGHPGHPERQTWGWQPSPSGSVSTGIPNDFATKQSQMSLNVLQCGDDPSDAGPGAMITIPNVNWNNASWSLTNYMANAHVFTKLNGGNGREGRLTTGAAQLLGLFPGPRADRTHGTPSNTGRYSHNLAGTHSTAPRQFAHIGDGLSNTILFGEGMRQCDGGASYRFAFLPAGYREHEHSFGIEASLKNPANGQYLPGSSTDQTFGNTLIFQTQPGMKDCNPFRLQAMHGAFLQVAMCDGSVRAISSLVDRREAIGAEACGRANFGTLYYTSDSRGGNAAARLNSPTGDGIWDMLMVPNDPTGNVLANTGEIGREK